jgi:DNA mismatch endonuclease (patch repair protein)
VTDLPPRPADEATRRRMQSTRRRDTKAELLIRSAVHRRGLRYRVDAAPLPGMRRRADLVFATERLAVFVDGCFWHGCPLHGTLPKVNRQWWQDKLDANQRRDRDTDRRLVEAGWHVLRAWEHEDPDDVAQRIVDEIRHLRRGD